jgi:hypothetical protein
MNLSVCPAAVVAAPVDCVWELLSEPALYGEWMRRPPGRIVPEGKASPGQVVYIKVPKFAMKWAPTIQIKRVDPDRHQIQFLVDSPVGFRNDQTTTCAALDAVSCRVQFG